MFSFYIHCSILKTFPPRKKVVIVRGYYAFYIYASFVEIKSLFWGENTQLFDYEHSRPTSSFITLSLLVTLHIFLRNLFYNLFGILNSVSVPIFTIAPFSDKNLSPSLILTYPLSCTLTIKLKKYRGIYSKKKNRYSTKLAHSTCFQLVASFFAHHQNFDLIRNLYQQPFNQSGITKFLHLDVWSFPSCLS